MEKEKNNRARLFFKRLLGIEAPEERQALDQLLNEHPEWRELPKELSNYTHYKHRQQKLNTLTVEKELRTIITPRRRLLLRRWAYRAAIVSIPIAIGAMGWTFFYMRTHTPNVEVAQITPATWGATLELSDGTVVNLSEGKKSITLEGGGVVTADSSTIHYQVAEPEPDAPIFYNRLTVGRNQKYKLALSDGTIVWLNSESTLDYPVTFGNSERRVKISGEAFFIVTKANGSPFVVESFKEYEIEVLGTLFDVKAYPFDSYSEVTLLQGSIGINTSSGERHILKPSQQMRLDSNGKMEIREVNPTYSISWTDNWHYFEDKRMDEALEILGRWYDVRFHFEDEDIRAISLTGKLYQFEIGVILDMISAIEPVEFEINGREITVKQTVKQTIKQ